MLSLEGDVYSFLSPQVLVLPERNLPYFFACYCLQTYLYTLLKESLFFINEKVKSLKNVKSSLVTVVYTNPPASMSLLIQKIKYVTIFARVYAHIPRVSFYDAHTPIAVVIVHMDSIFCIFCIS